MSSAGGVTKLLIEAEKGNRAALDEMLPLIYGELRDLPSFICPKGVQDTPFNPRRLCMKLISGLIDQQHVDWMNRAHFFGLAAEMMRRILTNHARDRAADKRQASQNVFP